MAIANGGNQQLSSINERRKMSVKRDVIAEVLEISEEEVTCENCVRFEAGFCKGWEQFVKGTSFCSFFCQRKGEENV